MRGYCSGFLWIILRLVSKEAHFYMQCHQGAKFEHFNISNMIYHKFSHGSAYMRSMGKPYGHVRIINFCKAFFFVQQTSSLSSCFPL